MANPKKKTIPTEENVDLLNEEDKVSESPSTLVTPSPDQEYQPGSQDGSKLSPNPAHFGFTSQRLVDSLPTSGELNVLYIVPIKTGGNEVVGYRKWTWDLETRSWRRVYGSIADLSLKDGGREQRAIVSNPNRSKPRVFNEDVNINGVLRVNGQVVTGEEDPTGGDDSNVYKGAYIGHATAFTKDIKPGDIIIEETGGTYIIQEITFAGDTLTKVVLLGLEDNATPTVYTYQNSEWSHADYNPATALVGKDINVEGITSKGIANTGNIGNIGDIATTGKITGGEIVENMTGYSFAKSSNVYALDYVGACKTGNKVTFVIAGKVNVATPNDIYTIGVFNIPEAVGQKLYPISSNFISYIAINAHLNYYQKVPISGVVVKSSNSIIDFRLYTDGLTANTDYYFRIEQTFLLSENLAPEE